MQELQGLQIHRMLEDWNEAAKRNEEKRRCWWFKGCGETIESDVYIPRIAKDHGTLSTLEVGYNSSNSHHYRTSVGNPSLYQGFPGKAFLLRNVVAAPNLVPESVLADVEHGAAVREALAPHPQVAQVHGVRDGGGGGGEGARVEVDVLRAATAASAVVERVRRGR